MPVLFSFFINQLDGGLECSLCKFADDKKQGGVVDRTDGRAATQRDPVRLEKWANRTLVNFITGKCQVLHLGWNNPMQQYRLAAIGLEDSLAGKDLEVLVVVHEPANVFLEQRQRTSSWAALGTLPAL